MSNLNARIKEPRALHPIHAWEDGIFNGYSCKIDFNKPTIEMINIHDIATALSKICRFNGHLSEFYSVAQHSMLVAHLAPTALRKAALLHDASEAYLGDVIKPLKHIIGDVYLELEQKFEELIAVKFNVSASDWSVIKTFDKQAVAIEFGYFYKGEVMLQKIFGGEPCWPHEVAKQMFLSAFKEVANG